MLPLTITLVYILAFTYLNRVRGEEKKPKLLSKKPLIYFVMSLVFSAGVWATQSSFLLTNKWFGIPVGFLLLPVDFISNWICFAFGWGKYFTDGENYTKAGNPRFKEYEFAPSEIVTNTIIGKWEKEESKSFVLKWQTTAMAFRFFFTFGILKFSLLAFLLQNYLLGFAILGTLLVGPLYLLAFKIKGQQDFIPLAEKLTGGYLALLSSLALWTFWRN